MTDERESEGVGASADGSGDAGASADGSGDAGASADGSDAAGPSEQEPPTRSERESARERNGNELLADDGPSADGNSGDDPSLGGILGAESVAADDGDSVPRPSLAPESPDLENVAFVVLGVVLSVLVIARLVMVLL